MGTVLVVADDLTGANAAAAGFARSGLRSVTAGAATRPDVVAHLALGSGGGGTASAVA